MPQNMTRRIAISLALMVAGAPFLLAPAAEPAAKAKTLYFTGKVVPLSDLLAKSDVRLDADASPAWLALAGDDGKTYPLVKDDGSRMFFKDTRLLNRPMRITGRLLRDSHLLQVLEVHSLIDGKLHEVYYWCEVCTIKRFEKKICDCCGAPMELREVPVK